MRIYKYKINLINITTLALPEDAEILSFQYQRGELYIWVLLDESAPTILRRLVIFETGQEIWQRQQLEYIGTTQTQDGSFVWHLFEIKEASMVYKKELNE